MTYILDKMLVNFLEKPGHPNVGGYQQFFAQRVNIKTTVLIKSEKMTKAKKQVKDYVDVIEELATKIEYIEDLVKQLLGPTVKELETRE